MTRKPGEKGPWRILLVEDHPLTKTGLEAVLAAEPDFRLVGWAQDSPTAIRLIHALKPHAVILDVQLESDDAGFAVLEHVRERAPGVRVVISSFRDERPCLDVARKLRADGYVHKKVRCQGLLEAVRSAMDGFAVFNVPRNPSSDQWGDIAERLGDLSLRELEVFALLGLGYETKQIPRILFPKGSPEGDPLKTIYTYRDRVKPKIFLPEDSGLDKTAMRLMMTPYKYWVRRLLKEKGSAVRDLVAAA